jgi:hypothetical protein
LFSEDTGMIGTITVSGLPREEDHKLVGQAIRDFRRRRSDMDLNPVISMLGRKLRLAVIGGGPGSFIGAMHRQAARLDDRYEIVTGILSSNPEKSKKA